LTVFFPCYNDAKSIGDLVSHADRQLRDWIDDYEIIVVNDGSTDDSAAVLAGLSTTFSRLRVVTHERNRGYGGALMSGFTHATKDCVFYTDGDGQYDMVDLAAVVVLLTEDTDFVNGMKMRRQDPAHRVFFGNAHQFMMRWLFWLPVSDVDCDFRLIRRRVLQDVDLTRSSGSICVELVKKAQRAGARFREVSVHHRERRFGRSQFFTVRRITATYADLVKMWVDLMLVYHLRRLVGLGSPAVRNRDSRRA
jgi:glycosyltransferase involved in cell wall biosynthesis